MKTHYLLSVGLFVTSAVALSRSAFADVASQCDSYDTLAPCSQDEVDKTCSNGGTCRTVACFNGPPGASTYTFIYRCVSCPTPVDNGNDGGLCAPSDIGRQCGLDGSGTCTHPYGYCGLGGPVICVRPGPTLPDWDAGPRDPKPDAAPDATPNPGRPDADSDVPPDPGQPDANVDAPRDPGEPDAHPDPGPDGDSSDAGKEDGDGGFIPPKGDWEGTGGANGAPGDDGGCSVAASSLRPSLPTVLSPMLLLIGAAALLFDRRRRRGE